MLDAEGGLASICADKVDKKKPRTGVSEASSAPGELRWEGPPSRVTNTTGGSNDNPSGITILSCKKGDRHVAARGESRCPYRHKAEYLDAARVR